MLKIRDLAGLGFFLKSSQCVDYEKIMNNEKALPKDRASILEELKKPENNKVNLVELTK